MARILYYIALIPAQLRKSGVVMDRHATLWLSEACGRCEQRGVQVASVSEAIGEL